MTRSPLLPLVPALAMLVAVAHGEEARDAIRGRWEMVR